MTLSRATRHREPQKFCHFDIKFCETFPEHSAGCTVPYCAGVPLKWSGLRKRGWGRRSRQSLKLLSLHHMTPPRRPTPTDTDTDTGTGTKKRNYDIDIGRLVLVLVLVILTRLSWH